MREQKLNVKASRGGGREEVVDCCGEQFLLLHNDSICNKLTSVHIFLSLQCSREHFIVKLVMYTIVKESTFKIISQWLSQKEKAISFCFYLPLKLFSFIIFRNFTL